MANMRVQGIDIRVQDDASEEPAVVFTWTWASRGWTVAGGPIYPKHVKLMGLLNEFLKEERP